jgi:branched-chain amino acid transport system permease protein
MDFGQPTNDQQQLTTDNGQLTTDKQDIAIYTFLQTLTNGISVGSLYALIALGYTLVFGILQFINFAHGDVFALGAILTPCFAIYLLDKIAGWHLGAAGPFICLTVVPVTVIACCAGVGFCIERFAYKPLRSAPRLNVLITAIGVSLLMENTGQLRGVFGTQPRHVPVLLADHVLGKMHGVEIHLVDVTVLTIALLLMIGLQWIVFHTKFGTAMRAVSFNSKAAALMGIHVDQVISITFVIGSALAGAAGYLYSMKYQTGTLNQPADTVWILLGMKAFVAAVVGGIGNIRGAMLGGLLIGLVEKFGASAGELGYQAGLWHTSINTSQYTDVYVFLLLILVLLVRPTGILGRATVEKV